MLNSNKKQGDMLTVLKILRFLVKNGLQLQVDASTWHRRRYVRRGMKQCLDTTFSFETGRVGFGLAAPT